MAWRNNRFHTVTNAPRSLKLMQIQEAVDGKPQDRTKKYRHSCALKLRSFSSNGMVSAFTG